MIQLDQIHVDIYIDPKISAPARRFLMREAEDEIRNAVSEAEYNLRSNLEENLKTQMVKNENLKFRIAVTKL
jgi:hypothetical protein